MKNILIILALFIHCICNTTHNPRINFILTSCANSSAPFQKFNVNNTPNLRYHFDNDIMATGERNEDLTEEIQQLNPKNPTNPTHATLTKVAQAEIDRKAKINEIDFSKLDLKNNKNQNILPLRFELIGNFSKLNETEIENLFKNKYNLNDLNKITDKRILEIFTDFTYFSFSNYQTFLKAFPVYNRFILSLDKQLNINSEFSNKLIDNTTNGQEIIKFINSEAKNIRLKFRRLLNTRLKQDCIPSISLSDLRSEFANKINSNEIYKQRIDAIDKTFESNFAQVTQNYQITNEAEKLLTDLKTNKELFTRKTGTIADQQLQSEFVTNLNRSADLYNKTKSAHIKAYTQVSTDFLITGAQYNNTNKALAYRHADAANDLLAFSEGVTNAFGDNMQAISKFLEDPCKVSKETVCNLAHLAQKAVVSTSKALIWTVVNAPDFDDYNPEIERIKDQNVEAKAKEIRQACDHIVNIIDNMPREEKFKHAGYIITDLILGHYTGKITSRILSLKVTDVKNIIERGAQRLDKLGEVGQEIAKITGMAIKRGLTATLCLII